MTTCKRLMIGLVACVLFANSALAQQQNPVPIAFEDVTFMENGLILIATVTFDDVHWVPGNTGWNGQKTSLGSEIENVDTSGITFPVTGINFLGYSFTITAAKVNDAWDDIYQVGTIGYNTVTRISEPSWEMNCHGYSTGLGFWVQGHNGYTTVIGDDWEIPLANGSTSMSGVVAGCTMISPPGPYVNHSIRIDKVDLAIGLYTIVTETSEKSGCSGIYKMVYGSPAGAGIGTAIGIFRKK